MCYIASLLPIGIFFGFFILGLRDRKLILKVLAAEKEERVNGRSHDMKSRRRS